MRHAELLRETRTGLKARLDQYTLGPDFFAIPDNDDDSTVLVWADLQRRYIKVLQELIRFLLWEMPGGIKLIDWAQPLSLPDNFAGTAAFQVIQYHFELQGLGFDSAPMLKSVKQVFAASTSQRLSLPDGWDSLPAQQLSVLAHLYYYGIGVQHATVHNIPISSRHHHALQCAEKAANEGDVNAQLLLATLSNQRPAIFPILRNDPNHPFVTKKVLESTSPLPSEYFATVKALAEKGWYWAQKELVRCYQNGIGVITNFKAASVWARRIGDQQTGCWLLGQRTQSLENKQALDAANKALKEFGEPPTFSDTGGDDEERVLHYCDLRKAWFQALDTLAKFYQEHAEKSLPSTDNLTESYAYQAAYYYYDAIKGETTGKISFLDVDGRVYTSETREELVSGWDQLPAEQLVVLGIQYLRGFGFAGDWRHAAACFKKAAEQGNVDGQFLYGAMRRFHKGYGLDKTKGERFLSAAAEKGHSRALMLTKQLKRAAELGNPQAQRDLADLNLFGGSGVLQNYGLGRLWLQRAVRQGNKDAISFLGGLNSGVDECYHYSMSLHKDIYALKTQLAAFRIGPDFFVIPGDGNDERAIGWCHLRHRYAEKMLKLISFYTTASKRRYLFEAAQYWVEYSRDFDLPKEIPGFPQGGEPLGSTLDHQSRQRLVIWGFMCWHMGNPESAENYFRTAAERGDKDGQYFYAHLLKRNGAESDEIQQWLVRAAFQGHLTAMARIGLECDIDADVDFAYCKKAAEQGHGLAQVRLAKFYYQGDHVERDDRAAQVWLARADAQGCAAKRQQKRLRELGKLVAKQEVKSWVVVAMQKEQASLTPKVGVFDDYMHFTIFCPKGAKEPEQIVELKGLSSSSSSSRHCEP